LRSEGVCGEKAIFAKGGKAKKQKRKTIRFSENTICNKTVKNDCGVFLGL
jgi:hypothetical protein